MSIFLPPSDLEVEAELGTLVGSWELRPPAEIAEHRFATIYGDTLLAQLLVLLTFALVIVVAWGAGKAANSTQVGALVGGVMLLVWILALGRYGTTARSLIRLGVFKSGIRLGRKRIRFDTLDSLEIGAPPSVMDQVGNAVNVMTISPKAREMYRVTSLQKDLGRRTALVLRLTNGKKLVWLSFCGIFSAPDLVDFFAAVSRLAPHLSLDIDQKYLRDLNQKIWQF